MKRIKYEILVYMIEIIQYDSSSVRLAKNIVKACLDYLN